MSTKVLSARVDLELKDQFESECEAQGASPSDVLRTLIKSFAVGDLVYTKKEESIDVRD